MSDTSPVWYILRIEQQFGPFSKAQLREHAQSGRLSETDYLWKEGMKESVLVSKVKGLLHSTEESDPGAVPITGEDARPFLPRSEASSVSKVEVVREQIYQYFTEACEAEGVEALILRTAPYQTPVGFLFACWVPDEDYPELRDRSSVDLTIEPREYHRFPYIINLVVQDNEKKRTYEGVVDFTKKNAQAIVRHLLRRSDAGSQFHLSRVRYYWWQLWRPSNPITRLGIDWLYVGSQIAFWIGVGLTFLIWFLGLPLALLGAILWIVSLGRYTYHINPGKPLQEPRILWNLDSWQALIPHLGQYEQQVRRQLNEELTRSQTREITVSQETIWQRGVDGIEERQQIVARLRRGIAFLHVYRYGEDLYIGWTSYLNSGDWIEEEVARGIDYETQQICRIMTIRSGSSRCGQYDLFDCNCLSEWVHQSMTKVVKRTREEHKIDAQIDFEIIRGNRQQALAESKEDEKKKKGFINHVVSFFRREG